MSLERFRKPVSTVAEDASVVEAARIMRERRVGCIVVVRARRPVGLLTDRDLALRVLAEPLDPARTRVGDVVTYDPFVLEEASSIESAAALMREHGVRRLPVVDATGSVVGLVTADDLVVLLGRELADVCEAVADAADASESR